MELNRQLTIINKLGMHARAAAKFVKLASEFSCDVELECNDRRINGKSIMGVLMLAAARGSEVTLIAEGEDAEACLDRLAELINNRFDEDE